jgi:hypothetical protein
MDLTKILEETIQGTVSQYKDLKGFERLKTFQDMEKLIL